ncbi:SUMF1/EgtB/PvdO family nonheme iron enzyme [Citrobacter sp. JGM124]|nr:SUMF1/EgtB/PvdO family nonheme iron enzyme [Citrobacter sp. JGM124]
MEVYIKSLTLFVLLTYPLQSEAAPIIPEAFIERGDYYVGDVFGSHAYATHTNVTLPSYFMMKTEITYALYQQVVNWANNNGYHLNSGCNGARDEECLPPDQENGMHPVTNIAWLDTLVFANALSEMHHLTPVYLMENGHPLRDSSTKPLFHLDSKAHGYRLPTLNEWHVAARGGRLAIKSGHYGDRHSGSDEADKVAWFPPFDAPGVGTRTVGQLSPNALGIFDMSGNVSEWVYDSYQLGDSIMYYFCGGSYLSHTSSLASCDSHSAGFVMPDIGFRLVRSAPVEN